MADFIPVESSNLAAIAFDPREDDETIGTLYVRFKNGGEFAYYDVPAEKYDNFLDAESKGKFYIANVKSAYACECTKQAEQKPKKVKPVTPKIVQPPLMRSGNIDL